MLAASLVLLGLVGGIVGTTLGLFEAQQQEETRGILGKRRRAPSRCRIPEESRRIPEDRSRREPLEGRNRQAAGPRRREAGRKLLYTTDMQLAPFLWHDDRTTAEQLRVLLAKHIPDSKAIMEKPDLRGSKWTYYQNLLEHSSAVFSGHDAPVVGGVLTPDGQLVTLDELAQVRRWDLDTQSC